MKSYLRLFIVLLIVSPTTVWANPKIDELSNREAIAFYPPQVFMQTLDSGTKVYYVQDQSLPLYEISAFVSVGRIHENAESRGLTDLLMRLWPLGGTINIQADDLIEKIDNLGAKIDADVSQEFLQLNLTTLAKYKDETLPLFFDLLQNPHFDERKLQILKSKVLSGMDMRNEKASEVASREFSQMLLGEKNPIVWKSNPDTIQSITRDAIQNFFAEHVAPNQVTLVAKGPSEFLDFLQLCEKSMQGWSKSVVPSMAYPDFTLPATLPDKQWLQLPSTQSVVLMGHLSVSRNDPDKMKITVLNAILGYGTIGSRLGNRIRNELGLAYDVSSQLNNYATTGIFMISAVTAGEQVFAVMDEMQSVFKTFVESDDITEQEFNNTKNKILNQSVFLYEKSFDLAWQSFIFDAYGYEKDYLEKYYMTIKNMTLAEAKAVIKTYFHPDQLQILIVGDKNKIKDASRLKEFKPRELDKE